MKEVRPPRLASKLFNWYCGIAKVEDLEGDLEEWFYFNLKTKTVTRAKLIYWKQVISLIFSYGIRKRKRDSARGPFSSSAFNFPMLQNYLKIAARNLSRQKYFTIVNVLGLSIGMSISLLFIAMYSHVSNYDNFHANKASIYRIVSDRTEGPETENLASAPAVLGEKLRTEYSSIDKVVRINSSFRGEVLLDKQNIPLRGYYVDPDFFSVFSFEMVDGDPATALTEPHSIILTESAAQRIFPNGKVLGETLELKGHGIFAVTGVMKDHPKNTHMKFEALASYSSLPAAIQGDGSSPEQWIRYQSQYIYLLVPEKSKTKDLQQALDNISREVYRQSETKVSFQLQALNEITPGPDKSNSIGPKWDYTGFIIFGSFCLLILLPACFNYTNISIARALKRTKEIGLRKTMGSLKNQIFFQFITETVLITLLALIVSLLLFMLLRSEFQSMLVEASALNLSLTIEMVSWFIIFALFTGFVAGVLPAVFFSGLNPIQALKSQLSSRLFSGMRVRKVLTIFQFFLSFCFIISLVGFGRQYQYALNFDFGFQKENILDIELQDVKPDALKAEFAKLSQVHSISMSSGILGLQSSTRWVRQTKSNDSTQVDQLFVDPFYTQNFGLKLLAGKSFPDAVWQREQYILVNEEFLKANNIANARDALGQTFIVAGKELEVIGVLKNFHYAPLQVPIRSFFFRMNPTQFTHANLKVASSNTYELFAGMEKIWNTLSDNRKFSARFLDDEINDAYQFYQSTLKIIGFLGLLAISISLLGLLGMVVYTSENKTKEVGIRKVMGASTLGITMLLSKDYFKLMLWAGVFAIPATVILFDKFISTLQYYRASLSVWDILLSLMTLLILGLATIASQTYKTASANPAETLKYE